MGSSKEKIDLPSLEEIKPPDYSTLIDWWEYWPEARTELLDFWARGNFTRRLLSRNKNNRSACIVRANYIDEIEYTLKRLALLDLEVDIAWNGTTVEPGLTIVPQDGGYQDSGGWGYMTAAGSKFNDKRGDKEWYPAMGKSKLLPKTLIDWLAKNATQFIKSGKLIVAPADCIGIHQDIGYTSEEHFQQMSNSASILNTKTKLETLFTIELPYLEGMSLSDTYKFCEDNKDSLELFQNGLSELLKTSVTDDKTRIKELKSKIEQGVNELSKSDKTKKQRQILTNIGAGITTFFITFGMKLGFDLTVASGGIFGAYKTLEQWFESLNKERKIRKNPYYILWRLKKGKKKEALDNQKTFSELHFDSPKEMEGDKIPFYHWLAPPTPGWRIPTMRRRESLE